MYYLRLPLGQNIIEFRNDISGEETVMVDGAIVSQKRSLMGTDHIFSLNEDGRLNRYRLTTRMNGLAAVIDLYKNGNVVLANRRIGRTTNAVVYNSHKVSGVKKLNQFDLKDALITLEKGIQSTPNDPEIYFYKACACSLLEKKVEAMSLLVRACELGLKNKEGILKEEKLAFIRIQPEFEIFKTEHLLDYLEDK